MVSLWSHHEYQLQPQEVQPTKLTQSYQIHIIQPSQGHMSITRVLLAIQVGFHECITGLSSRNK